MLRLRRWAWLEFLTVLLAAVLRLHGLAWSLPHTYEEATPLRVALSMWGWPGGGHVNLNPEFFNYPSLTFYLHFIVQGILYLVLRLSGHIHSLIDWQVLYLTDPTAMYVTSRLLNAAFGVATVFMVYRLGATVVGSRVALLPALLLATNPFHIARSQMIEVDIPLAFFVTLALYGAARVAMAGRRRDYVLAGIAIGLAASCKYTGVLVFVALFAAHVIALRGGKAVLQRWKSLGLALFATAATFGLTSPYVLIDHARFLADFSLESEHMELGHFGMGDVPAWRYYAKEFMGGVVEFACTLAALLGAHHLIARRRNRAAVVLAAFVIGYLGVVSTWAMEAQRYLLPVIPALLVLAGGAVAALADVAVLWPPRSRQVAVVVLALVLLVPGIDGLRSRASAYRNDARTDAQAWIEAHVPGGSWIVAENYAPDLLAPALLLQLDPRLRDRVLDRWRARPVFAVLVLPMYQTRPERSAPFYSLDLYPDADYVITTNAVRGRYERDPARFAPQLRFYADVERAFRRVATFASPAPGGVSIAVYRRATLMEPFARRSDAHAPPAIDIDPAGVTDRVAGFYFDMGANLEYYRRFAEASASYRLALDYGTSNRQVFTQCVLGETQCLLSLGRGGEALTFLDQIAARMPDEDARRFLAALKARISVGPGPH